jgi:hypothetical protein
MMAKYDWHLQNRIEINHFVAHVRATQISIPGFLFPTRDLKPAREKAVASGRLTRCLKVTCIDATRLLFNKSSKTLSGSADRCVSRRTREIHGARAEEKFDEAEMLFLTNPPSGLLFPA